MALATYNDLIASIAAWTHRTDLTSVIPDFIRMAESRMSMDLNPRQVDASATLTTTAGSNLIALPSDFNQMRTLSFSSGGNTTVLDAMPPETLTRNYAGWTTGSPRAYSLHGQNLLLAPTPNAAYDLTLEYFSTIPSLSVSNQTNVILTSYPDLYLHACLILAGQYIRDDALVANMEQQYAQDIERINIQNWAQSATMSTKLG